MRAFLFGILFLVVVGVAAFFGLKYFSPATSVTGSQVYKTAPVTKTGELRKTNVAGSDFTHVLVAAGKSTGVASYTLNLDDYIGKQVEITGQPSGDTLYADVVKVLQ